MKRLPMTLALAATVALAGLAAATPPGIDPALPEPADEPPNPERHETYYDGSVRAPEPPPGKEPSTDLGAPPVLPGDVEPVYGRDQVAPSEDEDAE